jgi:transposase InsO family protein
MRHNNDGVDRDMRIALARYEVISAYLALTPQRGHRRKLLEQLASKKWTDGDGEPISISAETLRSWVRRYRRGGLSALRDKQREKRGVGVLTPEQCEIVCRLKNDVPERSLEKIIRIAEESNLVEEGILRRSTVHRVLQSKGISARKPTIPDAQDLDRFEADFPNDLWQSDMLKGPWLPDPARPGKLRQAHLYAFIDDHSRLLLHGRFDFREDLPILELVFRRAVQRWGVPRRLYYDNGGVYRAGHMHQIVGSLSIHRVIYTRSYRPMGHGKVEAFNRSVRNQFIAEIKASSIRTLEELNAVFTAWMDVEYNTRIHSETGQTPLDRWRQSASHVKYADEEGLRQAFLWKEDRTPDKTGVLSLLGIRYQVGPTLARRRVQVRFDPENMREIEVWHGQRFVERTRPLQIDAHRRPASTPSTDSATKSPPTTPLVDWTGMIMRKWRKQSITNVPPAMTPEQRRDAADALLLEILAARLTPGAFDESAARDALKRFGPFDPDDAAAALDAHFAQGFPRDQHVGFYIDLIRTARPKS